MIGEDLVKFLKTLRERVDYVAANAKFLEIGEGDEALTFLYMPRNKTMSDDPSSGLIRYIASTGKKVDGLIYPDRRGPGFGMSRHEDSPKLDFTQIESEPDVHFAHARGFVAKTSATELDRLKELATIARVGE